MEHKKALNADEAWEIQETYSGKPPFKCRYYHPCVGYGDFVRKYKGPYGLGLIIKLDNGREWFAPINEFTRVR